MRAKTAIVTFENLREILPNPALWSWSLVTDIMSYEVATVNPDQPLDAALDLAHSINYSRIPVVKEGKLIAMLKIREIEKGLRNELIKKQEKAFTP
ncbi:MAG: CBS domain-containing protein [bacterium]